MTTTDTRNISPTEQQLLREAHHTLEEMREQIAVISDNDLKPFTEQWLWNALGALDNARYAIEQIVRL